MSEVNEGRRKGLGGFAMATACNPFYGIRRRNIVRQLSEKNWEKKGLWRMANAHPVYVYIQRGGRLCKDSLDTYSVHVRVYTHGREQVGSFSVRFPELESALKYANGEGSTALSALSRAAGSSEYPEDWPPQIFITIPGRRSS
jgi:hypothetical protein